MTISELKGYVKDLNTKVNLRIDEEFSRRNTEMEEKFKRHINKDMQRVNSELLSVNSNFTKYCTDTKNYEEQLKQKLHININEITDNLKRQCEELTYRENDLKDQISSQVVRKLKDLGLNADDHHSFRESLIKAVSENNPQHLIKESNKEL